MTLPTTVLSTKGQLVIPREVRERLGWDTGTRLEIVADRGGVLLRPARSFAETTLAEVIGCLPYAGPPLAPEDWAEGVVIGLAQGIRGPR